MENLFFRRSERHYPTWFYELVVDMFAIVQYWEPSLSGAERGRLFERVFHRYCDERRLPVSERPGARTIRYERSASGFLHETDAVIACPNLTVHCELKHLSSPLRKNELLIFNQKGMDFLLGGTRSLREAPFHRLLLSGEILTTEARRFALQWGIIVIEPDRLPLLLLHHLAGHVVPGLRAVPTEVQDEIWAEIPALLTPLQHRLRAVSSVMNSVQLDRTIDHLQRVVGDQYWMALERINPRWLEERFDVLSLELELDSKTIARSA